MLTLELSAMTMAIALRSLAESAIVVGAMTVDVFVLGNGSEKTRGKGYSSRREQSGCWIGCAVVLCSVLMCSVSSSRSYEVLARVDCMRYVMTHVNSHFVAGSNLLSLPTFAAKNL